MSLDPTQVPPVAKTSAKFKANLAKLKLDANKVAQLLDNAQASASFTPSAVLLGEHKIGHKSTTVEEGQISASDSSAVREPDEAHPPATVAPNSRGKTVRIVDLQALNTETSDNLDRDDTTNSRGVDEALKDTRAALEHPSQSEDTVKVNSEQDGTVGDDVNMPARSKSSKEYTVLSSLPTNGSACILCALDPTVGELKSDWTQLDLDDHLNGDFHTRANQIFRAAENEEVAGKLVCYICQSQVNGKALFYDHVKEHHAEYI